MKTYFVFLVSFIPLLLTCNLSSSIGNQIEEVKDTAQSMATDVHENLQWMSTVQAMAIQASGSELMQTAQAMATRIDQSGFLETAQAFTTQNAPGMIETAKSFATEQAPQIWGTMEAFATQVISSTREKPADIPIIEGENEILVTTSTVLSYLTTMDYPDVLAFYKDAMSDNGWEKQVDGTIERDNGAILYYKKSDRLAIVTLSINPINNKTGVLVTIQ